MWGTMIPVVIGALGTRSKVLESAWNSRKSEEESRSFRLQVKICPYYQMV